MAEHSRRIGLEQPHVQVVMVQPGRLQGLVPFHGALEWLAKEVRTLFYPRCERDEPLCPHEAHLVPYGFVQEDLGAHGIRDGSDETQVEE